MHERQHYELAHWTRGNTELSYRRFFAVTTLAGVRQEDEAVFDATHALVRQWVERGVTGLRIDHPDGLVDPGEYLRRLRALAPGPWITVEKILEPGEQLPRDWPVEGTTGYDAMREVNGLFVDPGHEHALTALYQRLTGDEKTIAEHVEAGKRMVVADLLPAEVRRMAALVPEVEQAPRGHRRGRRRLRRLPLLPAGRRGRPRPRAGPRRPARPSCADTLDALSPRLHDADDELARRMQQLSGATMAKGIEDTAFYRYARFVALNEVGGDPAEFGIALDAFHAAQQARQADQPQSMTGLSTHDTKRGEDVRARLAVLAEIPQAWGEFAELFLDAVAVPPGRSATSWPRPGRRRPDRARADARLRREGGAGGQRRHHLHRRRRGLRGRRARRRRRRLRRAPAADGLGRPVDAVTPHGWTNALGQKLVQLTMPGCRTSTRAPSCGTTRWWIPTTVGRSTSPGAGRCSPRSGSTIRPSTGAAPRSCG